MGRTNPKSSLPSKYVLHCFAHNPSAPGRGVGAWHHLVLSLGLPGKWISQFWETLRKSNLYAWVRGLMDLGVPPKFELRFATLVSKVGVPTAILRKENFVKIYYF